VKYLNRYAKNRLRDIGEVRIAIEDSLSGYACRQDASEGVAGEAQLYPCSAQLWLGRGSARLGELTPRLAGTRREMPARLGKLWVKAQSCRC